MKPISWSVTETKADPARSAREFVADEPRDGVVFVEDAKAAPDVLRFTVVAKCGSETPLLLGLFAAFSASEGIRKDTGIISWVRWPNAVTIEGKRVASTSAAVTESAGGTWAALDFQVNLLHDEVVGSTSLYDQLGVEVERTLLLDKTLESLSWMHFGWSTGMHPQMLRRVTSMTEIVGGNVSVQKAGRRASGVAMEIDGLGELVVRLDSGRIMKLKVGDELLQQL